MKRNLTPIASGVALFLMGVAMSAQAQEAQPAADAGVQTVVTTGIRASLQQSLNVKKNSGSHVEVISAEDIGKMPDKNVADSLQRVPGVAVTTAGGGEGGFDENDRVAIRGTSASLTQTTLNGHSVSSGEWFVLNQFGGGVGRSVSYTLLPSEIVSQIVVHKTSEASLLEGGATGSVDIITRKALDFKKELTLEASVGAVYADLPKKTDPQFNVIGAWHNTEKTFGIMGQAFYEKRSLRRDAVELLQWNQVNSADAISAVPGALNAWYPGLVGYIYHKQERKRTGGLVDVQFKPSNDLTFDLSLFSAKMDVPNVNYNYMVWAARNVPKITNPSQVTIQNGVITAANWPANPGDTNNAVFDNISRPQSSASSRFVDFDSKWRVNDALTLMAKVGASEGHGKTPVQDYWEGHVNVGAGAGYQTFGINAAPTPTFGKAVNAPDAGSGVDWIFGGYNYDIKDTERYAQIDGEFALESGPFNLLKFGARTAHHERGNDKPLGGYFPNSVNAAPATSALLQTGSYPGDWGQDIPGTFPKDFFLYTTDSLAAWHAAAACANTLTTAPTDGSGCPALRRFVDEYKVKENDSAVYVQGNFESGAMSGNVGLRAVKTKIDSFYYQPVPLVSSATVSSAYGTFLPTTVSNTYTDYLPSVNVKYAISKDLVLRAAATQTLTRPDYGALSGAYNVFGADAPGQIGRGTAGNPNLKNIKGDNLDFSAEYYFAPRALVSASLFYERLRNYVDFGINRLDNITATNATYPLGFSASYDVTAPINITAYVRGLELAYEQPIAGNFGIAANATFSDGNTTGVNKDVLGLAKFVSNVSGYYEDDTFNARLTYAFRDKNFQAQDRGLAYYQAAVGVVNMSLGYKLSENISFTLDGRNLNNPLLKYYGGGNENIPLGFYRNGRQYFLNARVKF